MNAAALGGGTWRGGRRADETLGWGTPATDTREALRERAIDENRPGAFRLGESIGGGV